MIIISMMAIIMEYILMKKKLDFNENDFNKLIIKYLNK